MKTLITTSLALNVLVLVPVCYGLLSSAGWTQAAYGPPSPARGIVLSVYLAILLGSLALLAKPALAMIAALLAVQVAYKLTTPLTVGTLDNPVVIQLSCDSPFPCGDTGGDLEPGTSLIA